MRSFNLILLCPLLFASCQEEPTNPGRVDSVEAADEVAVDSRETADAESDAADATTEVSDDSSQLDDEFADVEPVNACGGMSPLTDPASADNPAEPGQLCGACDVGALVCNSPDTLVCLGDVELNACGGCAPLAHELEGACGPCQRGRWVCDGVDAVVCVDALEVNACGGCEVLEEDPGTECGTPEEPATWRCVSPDELRCVPDDANVCGGEVDLDGLPGTLCGTCGRGTLVCDGADALVCDNEPAGVNACGGCAALDGEPGQPCGGVCGGVWECAESGGLDCSTILNGCGGCGPLEHRPGESCDGGLWVCDLASGDVVCAEDHNACGGGTLLDGGPGDACGECLDGRVICVSIERTACLGAGSLNACDGCGPLPGVPGEVCAPGAHWTCVDEQLHCLLDDEPQTNACGGASPLRGTPGDPCGFCDTGRFECSGANAVVCEREMDPSSLTWWPDTDRDGHGDRDADAVVLCERPDGGFAQVNDDCDDDDTLAFRDLVGYTDLDMDGYTVGGELTICAGASLPDGFRAQASEMEDCDDGAFEVNPGAPDEPDTEPIDSNCDGRDGELMADQYVTSEASVEELQAALDACVDVPGCDVLVEQGQWVLSRPLTVPAGVGLFGGYGSNVDLDGDEAPDPFSDRCFGDATWTWSGVFGESEHSTVLSGDQETDTTVLVQEADGAVLDGVHVDGSNEPHSGSSTYAIRVVDTDGFSIRHSRILGGRAGSASADPVDGANGAHGVDGGGSEPNQPYHRGSSECGAQGGGGAQIGSFLFPSCRQLVFNLGAGSGGAASGQNGESTCRTECDHANCDLRGGDGTDGEDGLAGECGSGGAAPLSGTLTQDARWERSLARARAYGGR